MPRRYEVRRKVWIECKIPLEDGKYPTNPLFPKEIKQLNAYEAVKQWAKEAMLDNVVPHALRLEDAIQLLQKHFGISREPAYRRAVMATAQYACLSWEEVGKRKYIAYNKDLDIPEADTLMHEEREERRKEAEYDLGLVFHEDIFNKRANIRQLTTETKEEPVIDIYAMLVEAGRKKQGVDLEQKDS